MNVAVQKVSWDDFVCVCEVCVCEIGLDVRSNFMTLIQQPDPAQPTVSNLDNLCNALSSLPPVADEAVVSAIFVNSLLETLGFSESERYPQFNTGSGGDAVDFAARKNTSDDIFLHTKQNPFLLVEVKGKNINLADGSSANQTTKAQLKKYLLSPKCKTAQWGIITNSTYIQLFRRHGKVVVPATANQRIDSDNFAAVINEIKQHIQNTSKSLTVCVYNNKGGVGKTTTLINLAAILRKHEKRVLVVDFDSQADTTRSLKLEPGQTTLSACLTDPRLEIRDAIVPFNVHSRGTTFHLFDVIPCDINLAEYTDSAMAAKVERGIARLRDLLKALRYDYDYILIDCPTQWLFFSQSGVFASDVVLIPTKHNGLTSLHNAAKVIEQFIPEIQTVRGDGAPIPLPVFFNGEKITDNSRQVANSAIEEIIRRNKALLPYFYPKATRGSFDKTIFEIPAYASVANAAFSHVPAVFVNRIVSDHYDRLAKEYFLHG